MENYKTSSEWAKNIVVLKQEWIPVNDINKLRMDVFDAEWKLMVVKKRIFLNFLKEQGFEDVELDTLEWSIVVLYSYEDEYAPLKALAQNIKQWAKEKKKYGFDYIWGWFEKAWKDGDFVKEIANMPSKEELLSKFVYLVNYPVQSFVMVLNEIAKKGWADGSSEEKIWSEESASSSATWNDEAAWNEEATSNTENTWNEEGSNSDESSNNETAWKQENTWSEEGPSQESTSNDEQAKSE